MSSSSADAARGATSETGSDIRDLIRRDHDELLRLCTELCEGKTSAARAKTFARLKQAAPAHDKPEEFVVYAALKKGSEESADLAHEGKVEHDLVSGLLGKLARARDLASDTAKAQAEVVKELLEHHIKEEHEEMFPLLESEFDAQRLHELGAAFIAEKQAFVKSQRGGRKSPPAAKSAKKATKKR